MLNQTSAVNVRTTG